MAKAKDRKVWDGTDHWTIPGGDVSKAYTGIDERQPNATEAAKLSKILAGRNKAAANRRALNDALDSIGVKRVRGGLGGVYFE